MAIMISRCPQNTSMPETNRRKKTGPSAVAGGRRWSDIEPEIAVTKSVTPAPDRGGSRTDSGGYRCASM
jgi:hypothetical protein